MELTINHREDYILERIFLSGPLMIGFSCYIWNIGIIKNLLKPIKKILPDAAVILGGPEAAHGGDLFLSENLCDIIAAGEGEECFSKLVSLFLENKLNKNNLSGVGGIKYLSNGRIVKTTSAPIDLKNLPFAHENIVPDGRIVYYESSRGCPYKCAYCLSGTDNGAKYKPVEKVINELSVLIKKGVKLIKFVDRTFNANKKQALEIWKFLSEAGGETKFHFEIAADLLDDEMLNLLKNVKKELFQFEIGVQTLNSETLKNINRNCDIEKLFENVTLLNGFGNIGLHLDLIAGLPGESHESFKKSFNGVYRLKPRRLQLGFLKLLHGAELRSEAAINKYGIAYNENAPYEVLFTNDISYREIIELKHVEEMLNLIYNSGSHKTFLKYAEAFYDPYFLYEKLFVIYERDIRGRSPGNDEILNMLYAFLCDLNADKTLARDLIVFDALTVSSVKSFPGYLAAEDNTADEKNKIREILKKLGDPAGKRARAEKFSYNILGWLNGEKLRLEKNIVLFKYPNAGGGATEYNAIGAGGIKNDEKG